MIVVHPEYKLIEDMIDAFRPAFATALKRASKILSVEVNGVLNHAERQDTRGPGQSKKLLGMKFPEISQGHANVARLLMERGARADVLDFSHRSPLALAAGGGYADCVRLFLSDSSAKRMLDEPSTTACADTRGRTPLLIAAGRGHVAVRLIPGSGTDPTPSQHSCVAPPHSVFY